MRYAFEGVDRFACALWTLRGGTVALLRMGVGVSWRAETIAVTLDGREADGTLWISQDEVCGHILLIPAGEEDVFAWDSAPGQRFRSEEEAMAWHDAHCPAPGKVRMR